jgi:hypothetical protein
VLFRSDATGEFVDDLKAEEELLKEKSAEAPPEGQDPNGDDATNVESTDEDTTRKGGNSGYGVLKTKSVVEDIFVNQGSFNKLIENAVTIEVSPLPMYGTIQNTFKEEKQTPSPKLCCVGLKQKGGNKRNVKTKKNKTKKNKTKTKKNKTKKNKTKTKKNKIKSRKY